MFDVADQGYQAAMMAPTDVLARQHYEKLTALCREQGLDFPVILLTGSLTAKEKREAYEKLREESPALIIGTHALIQENRSIKTWPLSLLMSSIGLGSDREKVFQIKGSALIYW